MNGLGRARARDLAHHDHVVCVVCGGVVMGTIVDDGAMPRRRSGNGGVGSSITGFGTLVNFRRGTVRFVEEGQGERASHRRPVPREHR